MFDQDIIYGENGKYCKYCAGDGSDDINLGDVNFDDVMELSNLPPEDLIKKADEVIEQVKRNLD